MTSTASSPTLHPALRAIVEQAAAFPPMPSLPVAIVRKGTPRALATGLPPEEVHDVEDVTIDANGHPMRLRIYRPDAEKGLPLILFYHGSGFVMCSIETHDAMCRQICKGARAIVVSVDYRLAPEHPFPAAPVDAWAALLWAASHARGLGADPTRIALCGDSAGANLAAITALRARDNGGPPVAAQALIYPVTDHYAGSHPSYAERGEGQGLTSADMRWFWNHYLPAPTPERLTAVSPLRRADLTDLPPAYITTAEFDVLRDEGEAYAHALIRAGVSVTARRYRDMNHGFLNWVGVVDSATAAMDHMTAWLRATLALPAQSPEPDTGKSR